MTKGLFGRLSIEDQDIDPVVVEEVNVVAIREKDDEYSEALVEGDQHIADIHEAMEIQEEAEEKVVALESLQAHEFTPYIAKDAEMYYRTLCKRVGMSYETISTENADTAIHLSTEGIKEFIKTMVEAIKAIIKKIVNFFKRMFGIAIDVANNDEKVAAKEASAVKESIKEDPSVAVFVDKVNEKLGESTIADNLEAVNNNLSKVNEGMARIIEDRAKLIEKLKKATQDDVTDDDIDSVLNGFSKKENTASSENLDLSTEDHASNMHGIVNSYTGIVNRHLSTIALCHVYGASNDLEKIYKTIVESSVKVINSIDGFIKNPALEKAIAEAEKVNAESKDGSMPAIAGMFDKLSNEMSSAMSGSGISKLLTPTELNHSGFFEYKFDETSDDIDYTISPLTTLSISATFLIIGYSIKHNTFHVRVAKTKLTKKAIEYARGVHAGAAFTNILKVNKTDELVKLVRANKNTISIIRDRGNEMMTKLDHVTDVVIRMGERAISSKEADEGVTSESIHVKALLGVMKATATATPAILQEVVGSLIYADKSMVKMLNHNRMLALMNQK